MLWLWSTQPTMGKYFIWNFYLLGLFRCASLFWSPYKVYVYVCVLEKSEELNLVLVLCAPLRWISGLTTNWKRWRYNLYFNVVFRLINATKKFDSWEAIEMQRSFSILSLITPRICPWVKSIIPTVLNYIVTR